MNEKQYYQQQGSGGQYLEPHRGTMVLIFGILGILCCGIFAVLAWVFGQTDINKMRNGVMDANGMEITNIGKILGIVGVCIWIAGTFIYTIFFGFAAFFG
jgi:hypothetical protein